MILWSINDQIMSVIGLPVPILHTDGGHLAAILLDDQPKI